MKKNEFTEEVFRSRKVDLRPLTYRRAEKLCVEFYGLMSRETFSRLVEDFINDFYDFTHRKGMYEKVFPFMSKGEWEIRFKKFFDLGGMHEETQTQKQTH